MLARSNGFHRLGHRWFCRRFTFKLWVVLLLFRSHFVRLGGPHSTGCPGTAGTSHRYPFAEGGGALIRRCAEADASSPLLGTRGGHFINCTERRDYERLSLALTHNPGPLGDLPSLVSCLPIPVEVYDPHIVHCHQDVWLLWTAVHVALIRVVRSLLLSAVVRFAFATHTVKLNTGRAVASIGSDSTRRLRYQVKIQPDVRRRIWPRSTAEPCKPMGAYWSDRRSAKTVRNAAKGEMTRPVYSGTKV